MLLSLAHISVRGKKAVPYTSATKAGKTAEGTPCESREKESRKATAHLRLLSPVAAVVDGCGDDHHQGREEVPGRVVVLPAGELALKHLHQHEVQLHALQTHPGEGRQEEEVEDPSDDGAHQLQGRARGVEGDTFRGCTHGRINCDRAVYPIVASR